MANGSNGSPGVGNTKRPPMAKAWCLTLNNYTDDEYGALKALGSLGSTKFIIGKEVGEEGTPHLQGYIRFDRRIRPLELKGISKRIHWERSRGSEKENIKYCSKDGVYETNLKVEEPLDILQDSELYDWQIEIIGLVSTKPDKRSIHWYWEPVGNSGKTTFMKYLMAKHDAIPVEGKKNDILFCTANHESRLYVFDFERSMETYISYAAMEKVKNGAYMCSKYESKPILRNSPHVICFANFKPDETKLSKDRWVIKRLGPNGACPSGTRCSSGEDLEKIDWYELGSNGYSDRCSSG